VLAVLHERGERVRRQDVLRDARARAAFSQEELALAPTAGGQAHHASLVDEYLHWSLTNLKRRGEVENPERGWWSSVTVPRGPEPLAPPVSARRLEQLHAMPYQAYLRTTEWRRTREAAIALAGGRCQLEAAHDGTLHVHHSDYARRGAETTADLLVLCEGCHRRHHQEHGRPGPAARVAASAPPPAVSVPPPSGVARQGAAPSTESRRGLRGRLRALLA
jgi:hypothetical protein